VVVGQPEPRPDFALLSLQSLSGLDDYVEVIEGRLAAPTNDPSRMEAVIPIEHARYLGIELGQQVQGVVRFDDCNRPAASADPDQARELQNFRCTPQTFV